MVVAKKWVLAKRSVGFPKETDIVLQEETLPELKDNEFLVEAVYLSVDPYMRAYMPRSELNTTMIGSQVGKIVESKNPKFPVGKYVVGQYGWRTHTIASDNSDGDFSGLPTTILPDLGGLPLSLALGVLGMPGNTAYFGLLEICKPKAGETVVVSGAAGAVGSIVGQIAKIKGCTVVGIAGSDQKGKWLTEELGFDSFINYKTDNVEEALKKAAPKGVDCYFDNVGGEISTIVMNQMNDFGRVSVCGAISYYNEKEIPKVSAPQFAIVSKQLMVEGFIVVRWVARWMEGIKQNTEWIKQGKLKYHETVTEGFENMFKAFVDMLKGGNVGKAVVKA
ncbi:prostaglandin reductase 1-like [Anthonomus grandis grandis]|uniref:prostaglandin reductase 1-like n=1 Tax=Anthonomus grandis grandis TaxID=2921223 RepID=UPI002165C462|nr:prostaglandin reductase 1-like [Anthonomus grandis grandis]